MFALMHCIMNKKYSGSPSVITLRVLYLKWFHPFPPLKTRYAKHHLMALKMDLKIIQLESIFSSIKVVSELWMPLFKVLGKFKRLIFFSFEIR